MRGQEILGLGVVTVLGEGLILLGAGGGGGSQYPITCHEAGVSP